MTHSLTRCQPQPHTAGSLILMNYNTTTVIPIWISVVPTKAMIHASPGYVYVVLPLAFLEQVIRLNA